MISKIVKYKCKVDKLSKVLENIDVFVQATKDNEPDTIYSVYRAGEFEFYHIMSFPNVDAELKHRAAKYTEEFVSALYPSCTKGLNTIALEFYTSTRTCD